MRVSKFTINVLWLSAVLLILGLASYLSLAKTSAYGLTNFLWLFLLLPALGWLLSTHLVNKRIDSAERVSYSAGLLIFALFMIGLFANTFGILIKRATLVPSFIIPIFDLVFMLETILMLRRSNDNSGRWTFKHICISPWVFVPMILPCISLLGVVQLNNAGPSTFAMLNICAVALYEIVFFLNKRTKSESEYLINLFCISLAMVLSYSMRSNHIIGYDINQEFQVFQGVLRSGIWQPHLFHSTYNACLSVTVLPAVLKSLLQISPEYIFKFVMQIILCVVPIVVYQIAKVQLRSKKLATIASLFFILQAQFMFEFPALIRQQSALLFFGLIFVVASTDALAGRKRRFALLLFGVGLILSHYSTAYVCLAFLLLISILNPLSQWLMSIKKTVPPPSPSTIRWRLSPLFILILLLLSFCWYGETLQSTGGLTQKISNSITDFSGFFASDTRSSFVASNLGIGTTGYDTETLASIEKANKISGGYASSTYSTTTIEPASPDAPILNSGLKRVAYHFIVLIVPLIIKFVVLIGALTLLVASIRHKVSSEEGLFVLSGGLMFVLLIALPNISEDYNLQRLYQQLLIVLAPCFILGVRTLLSGKRARSVSFYSLGLLILYFFCTSNLANQATLGFSDVNLINDGSNYDHLYVKDGEVASLQWLQSTYSAGSINFDRYSVLRAEAYTEIPEKHYLRGMLPSEISAKGYVYASDANLNKGLAFDYYKNQIITYAFPYSFLSQQKNLLFSDGGSAIYK